MNDNIKTESEEKEVEHRSRPFLGRMTSEELNAMWEQTYSERGMIMRRLTDEEYQNLPLKPRKIYKQLEERKKKAKEK